MIFPSSDNFTSRRSPVASASGLVASSQVPATQAGVSILRKGGSAADAAVATAAALQVTQACSTGLGGDVFVLYFDVAARQVYALNGSGRSPAALTPEIAAKALGGDGRLPPFHAHTITVPGAPAAWVDLQKRFGRLPMGEVLAPAVKLARQGFAIGLQTSRWWSRGYERQLVGRRFGGELAPMGRGPVPGDIMSLPTLADSLETLATEGSGPFYEGKIAEAIVREIRHEGGVMTLQDLADHRSEWVEPVSVPFASHRLWECPPNGQGLAALVAVNVYRFTRAGTGKADRLHRLIESMRIGFADAASWVCDPEFAEIPVETLLSEEYGRARAQDIGSSARLDHRAGPSPWVPGKDTVYLSTLDGDGNGCSFINSNYMGFGTGIVPEGCGYSLQNRGHGFILGDSDHPNRLEPRKRPYHTIIPGLITDAQGALRTVYGVMGGMMQPQGHLQVAVSLLEDGIDPQGALDLPRFQLEDGKSNGVVLLEDGFDTEVLADLSGRDHSLRVVTGAARAGFGLGQAIHREGEVWWGGSDPRGDGCPLPG